MIQFLQKLLIIVILGIGIAAYVYYVRSVRVYDDTLITDTGIYRLSGNRKLHVWENNSDFVRVMLLEDGNTLIYYDEPASRFQKYRVIWESANRRLWINSSDIGAVVYLPKQDGSYVTKHLVPDIDEGYDRPQMLIDQVPPNIRSKLNLD